MHFPPELGTSGQQESHAQRRARFEQEALPHRRTLYAAAGRMTRHAADAEDLVQEAYTRVRIVRPVSTRHELRGLDEEDHGQSVHI
ncbi:sigma factor [Streptomyces sp. NBC_01483]|uniref:sigma factor n=1 Tax=Streptomyces sp. NBC_01483 TaxID=2903883 RepID=UPI003FCDF9B6